MLQRSSRAMSTPRSAHGAGGRGSHSQRKLRDTPIRHSSSHSSSLTCALLTHSPPAEAAATTRNVHSCRARACTRRGRRGSSHPSPSSYRARCASRPAPSMTHTRLAPVSSYVHFCRTEIGWLTPRFPCPRQKSAGWPPDTDFYRNTSHCTRYTGYSIDYSHIPLPSRATGVFS